MKINLVGVLEDGSPRQGGVPDNPRTTLEIPKGSSVELVTRVITPAGVPVSLNGDGTELLLTIRRKPDHDPKIVRKAVIAGGQGTFVLEPGDTRLWNPGLYGWDVWLTKNGERNAVIPLSPFKLLASAASTPAAPPPQVLELVEGDTDPTILDFSGADITDWQIEIHIGYRTGALIRAADIIDGPDGIAQVQWQPGDLMAGRWSGEVQVTKPGPAVKTSQVFIFYIRAQIA